tara:strand:- start:11955 stop:12521 length:567 start_codon:yes stop_codon:yes gene_type:complete
MTIPSCTDDLIAEIECWHCETGLTLEQRSEADGNCPHCSVDIDVDEYLARALARIKELEGERVAQGTQRKRERWLRNINQAIKCGLPKHLTADLRNTAKEIENSMQYGGTKRLRDRIAELEEAQKPKTAEQRLMAAGVFKGAGGLRRFCEAKEFWAEQDYGTRFYFGPNANDYLHHGVLATALRLLDE